MPLFGPIGPIGPATTGSSLFGVEISELGNSFQRRLQSLPSSFYSTVMPPPAPPTTTGSSLVMPAPGAASAAAAAAPAPPAMQSIGTSTTRRTQLFGPLASVAI